MKLSVGEIIIIIDALGSSLSIANWERMYKFTPEARERLMNKLFSFLDTMNVDINEENIGE